MLIEHGEALKAWLTNYIEPLCDADPAALAKYVIALIKKEKPLEELRESMENQMQVFLLDETKHFADILFHNLESKDYLNGNPPPKQKILESSEMEKKLESTTTIITPTKYDEESKEEDSFKNRKSDSERAFRKRGRSSPSRHSRRYDRRPRFRSPGFRRSPSGRRSRRSPPYRRSISPLRRSRDSTPTRDDSDLYTPAAALAKKRPPRCRDYDEKGFCMRGDMCKYDHGMDAVVLEDSTNTQTHYLPPGSNAFPEPYVPGTTVISPTALVLPPLHVPPPGYAVPSTVDSRKRGFESLNSEFPNKRGRRGRRSSAKLAVRNIPPIYNNIAQLNNHFARFGKLVNIQVQFEDDPGSALVSFFTASEAEAAINSSDAVMGNRFIKMYFHYDKPEHKVQDVRKSNGESNENKSCDATSTPESNSSKADEKAAEIAAIQKNQELLELKTQNKKSQENKKIEAVKKFTELRRSKQALLEKLIVQQKLLISKIEKGGVDAEKKNEIMKLLKALSISIDQAKDDVTKSVNAVTMPRKTSGEVQKELLDAELELFQRQQDNGDVSDIQKKITQLKVEAAKRGLLPTSKPSRGSYYRGAGRRHFRGGYYRGRSSRGFGMTTSVDRRPSKILVSGFEVEDKDGVFPHFQKFGEIVDTIEDTALPSFIFQYKSRREAEAAMIGGKSYGDRLLQLSWYTSATSHIPDIEEDNIDSHALEQSVVDDYTPLDPAYLPPGLEEDQSERCAELEDDEVELNADDLLYDEEEVEDEERSWKR